MSSYTSGGASSSSMAAQHCPYGRNLIKNPCGEDGMKYWICNDGRGGWKVEKQPMGAQDFNQVEEFNLSGVKSCFATSYGECTKFQIINLKLWGFQETTLDHVQPEIKIEDWHATRFDSSGRYALKVQLLDTTGKPVKSFCTGNVDEPEKSRHKWRKVEHSFSNYGPGVRFVKFFQTGRDLSFWNGTYGSKMTASSVRVAKPPDVKKIEIKTAPREEVVNRQATNLECAICFSEERNMVFLPCRHCTCCKICSEKLMEAGTPQCPTCRGVVESTLQIYM